MATPRPRLLLPLLPYKHQQGGYAPWPAGTVNEKMPQVFPSMYNSNILTVTTLRPMNRCTVWLYLAVRIDSRHHIYMQFAQVADDVINNRYKTAIVHVKSVMCNIHCMKILDSFKDISRWFCETRHFNSTATSSNSVF